MPYQKGLAAPERFAERIGERTDEECLTWDGGQDGNGYGRFYLNEEHRYVRAHQMAWFLATGEWVKAPLTLDHECHNRSLTCKGGLTCRHRLCVEPSHLLKRTLADNVSAAARPRGPRKPQPPLPPVLSTAGHGSEAECPAGHRYDDENTYRWGKRRMRMCRTCHRERQRRYRAAKAEA